MISRDETERLAAMANALRPDWPLKSLTTFIVNELTRRTYREVAIALAWIATDPATDTPKRMLEAGPWWNASRAQAATVSVVVTRCPEHPEHPAARCPACETRGEVDHDAGVAAVREALRSAPRYEPPAVKAARAAERRGA
ncbi:MAG: hypothetical protein IPN98_08410 [Propionivibrio sp.]|nr:hypothetical protein [Propionivibrio sp.]